MAIPEMCMRARKCRKRMLLHAFALSERALSATECPLSGRRPNQSVVIILKPTSLTAPEARAQGVLQM